MRNLLVIVGRAAAGKTTLEKMLEKELGYTPLISHTTRPQRPGEEYGKEYYFTNNEHMQEMIERDRTLENASYIVDGEKWWYAITKEEVWDKEREADGGMLVVTLNPNGISQVFNQKEFKDKMVVLYMTGDLLGHRYLIREGASEESLSRWNQRKAQDEKDFEWFEEVLIPQLKNEGIPVIEYNNRYSTSNNMTVDQIKFIDSLVGRIVESESA